MKVRFLPGIQVTGLSSGLHISYAGPTCKIEFYAKIQAMFQELQLLDILYSKFKNVSLDNVALVTCQHILQSNYITLEYLFRLGLKPKNTYLLGKAYSSNKKVAEQLSSCGAVLHEDSFSFDSHQNYDLQLEQYIREFLTEITPILQEDKDIEKIIVVDDGGQLVLQINDQTFQKEVVALEWTSSGYRKLLSTDLKIPVLNMARSDTKLRIESPIIGRGVVEKIQKQYPQIFSSKESAVVIGAGPIGQAVKMSLEKLRKKVLVADLDTPINGIKEQYDLIVGCTGKNVLRGTDLNKLHNILLVSASSSDREFSAVEIRREFTLNHDPHKEYSTLNVTLANSGFPINFDGDIQFLPLEEIQITLGMVFASVCLCASYSFSNGLNSFPSELDKEITYLFLRLP